MDMHTTDQLEHLKTILPELAREARSRAEEFEEGRNISLDFVAKLKDAGVYRILVEREQGGLGGTLHDWLHVITTLAEADASTGWTSGHGAICSGLIARIAEPDFVETFFADPNNSVAWSNLPRVEVVEEAGGLRINGRWAFETGCTAANYVGGMLAHPDSPADGPSHSVVALAPIGDARIDATWDPIGLAGTGSHEVIFEDVLVPPERIFDWPNSKLTSDLPTAIYATGNWFIPMCAAAVHLGLARRALDEARNELQGKMERSSGSPLIESQSILETLEESEGLLLACRAGIERTFDRIQEHGETGVPLDKDLRLQTKLAFMTAVHQGEKIVRAAYGVAGASAVRRAGVMQRLYRDASCLIHHVSVNRRSFEKIGRVRIGAAPLDHSV